MWAETRVVLRASRTATLTTHHITASGRAGDYEFTVMNRPLESNPATSATVPAAILQGISRLASPSGAFV
jgi:aspartate dehydrogenase